MKIFASVIMLSFATVSWAESAAPAQVFLDKAAQGASPRSRRENWP